MTTDIETTPANYSPRLYNSDLAPVEKRTWKVYDIFAMWMQDIHSITVYTFAASLFFMGLNGIQVFIALAASVLIIWGLMNLSGLAGGHISFNLSPHQAHGLSLAHGMLAAIALNVSFFATFLVNFADFGRLTPDKRTVIRGNFFGLPVNFIVFAIVSVTVTSASITVFGEAITDPVELIQKTDSTTAILIGAMVFVVATIGINIVADFISCAYDFANLAPKKINFFRGGVLAAVLSVLPLPWHLYNNPESIAYFVGGLGAFLGPLFGVLISDYWVIKRGHIDVDQLYTEDSAGRYYFLRGFNPRALIATVVATVPAAILALVPAFSGWAPFSWAIGAGLAAVVHLSISWSHRAPSRDVIDADGRS